MNDSILVVDDDEGLFPVIKELFSEHGFRLISARNGAEGVAAALRELPRAVILDLRLPDVSGLVVLRQLRRRNYRVPVVMLTSYGNPQVKQDSHAAGATRYFEKPVLPRVLLDVLLKEISASGSGPERAVIVGRSALLEEAMGLAESLAASDLPVLVEGESGTGKEMVTEVMHALSPRRGRPFEVFDPSTIPETLLDSALFGHERGAFTGATERRQGKFEAADGGTLVIDEIGNLPFLLQGKLLRVLQERRLTPLGASRAIGIDVRLLSSTNADLSDSVRRGTFRLDLYHRLKGARIYLPPLRDRREDIPDLVAHFLSAANLRTGKVVTGARPVAMRLLQAYGWPGNLRELRNVVTFAHCVATETIGPADLPSEVRDGEVKAVGFDLLDTAVLDRLIAVALGGGHLNLKSLVTDLSRRVEERVLERLLEGHTQASVAAMVGMDPGTLSRKLQRHRDDGVVAGGHQRVGKDEAA